ILGRQAGLRRGLVGPVGRVGAVERLQEHHVEPQRGVFVEVVRGVGDACELVVGECVGVVDDRVVDGEWQCRGQDVVHRGGLDLRRQCGGGGGGRCGGVVPVGVQGADRFGSGGSRGAWGADRQGGGGQPDDE